MAINATQHGNAFLMAAAKVSFFFFCCCRRRSFVRSFVRSVLTCADAVQITVLMFPIVALVRFNCRLCFFREKQTNKQTRTTRYCDSESLCFSCIIIIIVIVIIIIIIIVVIVIVAFITSIRFVRCSSIPIFSIIIRYNLLHNKICNKVPFEPPFQYCR